MAKKQESSEVVKYELRFTTDFGEHKKGSVVTCGPQAYEVYKDVTEVLTTKNK